MLKRGLKLRPFPVKNGNFIAWECTEVVIPSVDIPKQKKCEKNSSIIHCSNDSLLFQTQKKEIIVFLI